MGRRSLVFGLWLAAMVVAGLWLQARLIIGSDLRQFLPRQTGEAAPWLSLLTRNENAGLILLAVDAGEREATIRLSRRLRERLLASGRFSQVRNGEPVEDETAFASLFEARYLLSPDVRSEAFTVAGLRQALQARLADLRAGMGPLLQRTLSADPHNFFLDYLESVAAGTRSASVGGVWMDREGRRALLVLQIGGEAVDARQQRRAVAALREMLESLSREQAFRWLLSGPAVFADTVRTAIQHTTATVSLVAGALMLFLFMGVYRRPHWVLLMLVPLLSAVVAGLVATQAVFGQVHGITLAYGITTLGVCVDYGIHLFSHLGRDEDGVHGVRRIWPTLRLGALTTVAAYLALLGTDFTGLSQMAVFSASGILAAALTTRFVVAALVRGHPGVRGETLVRRLLRGLGRLPVGARQGLVVGGLVIATLLSVVSDRDFWADDIAALSPVPPASRHTYADLARQIGLPDLSHLFIWRGDAPEQVLQASASLDDQLQDWIGTGVIGGFASASRLLPSRAQQARRQAALPDPALLKERLARAQTGLPFRAGFFAPFVEGVAASRTRPWVEWADFQDTPLAPVLASRLYREGGKWYAVTRLVDVRQPERLRQWARAHPEAGRAYVNLRRAVSAHLAVFRERALQRLLWGGLVVAGILWLSVRSASRTGRLVLPIALGLALTVLILVLAGVRLHMFHLLALVLVAGLGLDYSLFLGRAARAGGIHWRDLHGVLVGALTTVMAFGILGLSGIPVLRALGMTVAIGATACLLSCLLFAQPRSASARGGPGLSH